MPSIQIDEVTAEIEEQPAAAPEAQANGAQRTEPPMLNDVIRTMRRIQRRADRLQARY
jgi:hypothetical protein